MQTINVVYYISEYNYETKRNKAVMNFTDKFMALDYVFQYAVEYLEKKDGLDKTKEFSNFLFNKKKFRTNLKNSLSPGHYIVRDPENHVYKLEIWKKDVKSYPGWMGNTLESIWTHVFDIDIFEIEHLILNPINFEIKNKSEIIASSKFRVELNTKLEKSGVFNKLKEEPGTCPSKLFENFKDEFGKFNLKKSKLQIIPDLENSVIPDENVLNNWSPEELKKFEINSPINIKYRHKRF